MHWRSKLIHPQRRAPEGFKSLATATYRGSTVVFDSHEGVKEGWRGHANGYSYGIYGTPTSQELAARIADLEGAKHTFLTPSGQSAVALIYLAFCDAGSHVLVPRNAYGPNRELAANLQARFNIDVELYEPNIGVSIAELIRPETSLIWCESPGSITMEVQDVPAIVAASHVKNVPVALDNTYAAGVLFDAFGHGVDLSMQALTKYVGGHSDLLLGSVSVASESAYIKVGDTHRMLGLHASPDDCSLALRGLQTMAVRLDAMAASALAIAEWLQQRPEVATVLHPALSSCPGHEFWKRDFTGAASVFSVLLAEDFTQGKMNAFVDALKLFKIGWSWGGVNSLVMAYPATGRLASFPGRIVRFHIGLEEQGELIADLSAALPLLHD